jgi:hypothetical protein
MNLVSNKTRGGVSHCGLAIYIEKKVPSGKRRIMETSNAKNMIFKMSSKRNQNPSRLYYN